MGWDRRYVLWLSVRSLPLLTKRSSDVCLQIGTLGQMDRLNDIGPCRAVTELVDSIEHVLEEAEFDPGRSRSLIAGVARAWSWLFHHFKC